MAIHRVLPREVDRVHANEAAVAQSATNGIRRGDQGSDVVALQRELHGAGRYNAAIDGDFGPITQAAVQTFQTNHGLPSTGVVDAATARALKENDVLVRPNFADPAHRGQKGSDILGVEKKLSALGYDTGKADGIMTKNTVKAVRAFRTDHHLPEGNAIDATVDSAVKTAAARSPTALFDKNAPPSDYHRISYSGVTINQRTKDMMSRAETIMDKKYGHKGFSFDLVQGSYNTSVSASAGTHAGGGAMDVHDAGFSAPMVDDMVRSLREAGFAAWSRGRGHDSFPPHIHAIALGDREMSSEARQQIVEYAHGGDGLVGSSPDADARLGRPVPDWAKQFL